MNETIAEITDFSFAYIKEVFITSLLTIVGAQKGKHKTIDDLEPNSDKADEFNTVPLLRVIKKQVETLRVEMEGARKSAEEVEPSSTAQKGGSCHCPEFYGVGMEPDLEKVEPYRYETSTIAMWRAVMTLEKRWS